MKHLLCSDVKYLMVCAVTSMETETELNINVMLLDTKFQVFTVVVQVVWSCDNMHSCRWTGLK
jgi:hypothetical protein